MYTLRRILENGTETHFLLGNMYSSIMKSRAEKEFDVISKDYWGESYEKKKENIKPDNIAERDCYGFIIAEDGTHHFLLPWQENYIMTSGGKTFSHL